VNTLKRGLDQRLDRSGAVLKWHSDGQSATHQKYINGWVSDVA